MMVRATILASLFAIGLFSLATPARADLIGSGTNTVNALFFLGAHAPGSMETEDFGSPPVAGPAIIGAGGVDFVEGVLDLSTIDVGATQIIISNLAPPSTPFCSVSTIPCPDSFTGFEFVFSSGVNIKGVSADGTSAADFLPNSGTPHNGLQLLSPTDILVDVTGDAPKTGDKLILDLSFPTTTVPEPSTISLLAGGLLATLYFERRRRQARMPAR
jgi:hypothetical protein